VDTPGFGDFIDNSKWFFNLNISSIIFKL